MPRLTNDVYHYTAADIAVYSILGQMEMRLAPYESTNDLDETKQKFPSLSSHEDLASAGDQASEIWQQADWWLRRYVKVACFTEDFELPDRAIDRNALRGWRHMSQWAHYGARHSGVCFRFDRAKLIEQFYGQLGSRGQCFSGAVRYPVQRFSTLPVDSIDVSQVLEFGTDAVVAYYIEKNHEALFFTKHHDWANECEFRLVLNEPSLMPAYLNISGCLTGVFLGDAFPAARFEAVRDLLSRMPEVELIQLRYVNGGLLQIPAPSAVATPLVSARRPGTAVCRLDALRSLEVQRDQAKDQGSTMTAGVLESIERSFSAVKDIAEGWDGVKAAVHQHIYAVPPRQRGRRPGVPGEVVEFERGWMCVVENMPEYSYTLIIAAAVQLLEVGTLRLHASIAIETWSPTGNETSESWRVCRETSIGEAPRQIGDLLDVAAGQELQNAKQEFDALRSS